MHLDEHVCLIVSDFNTSTLGSFLAHDEQFPVVRPIQAPYGQVIQIIRDSDHPVWAQKPNLAVVWTRPEAQIPGFKRLLKGEAVQAEEIMDQVVEFADNLKVLTQRVTCSLVPTWTVPPTRIFRTMAMRANEGIGYMLMKMNLQLVDSLGNAAGMYVLNASDWLALAGAGTANPKLWYLAKDAHSPSVYKEAIGAIKSTIRATMGATKKLVVVDLDNTLWGGVLGDVGSDGLTLGGHDPAGEAYVDFQEGLKSLITRGVLVGIVSRNDEAAALAAIQNHSEMILRLQDFAGWRINWEDKAANVEALATALNLGLDSVVFIDDDPFQRGRVREALPSVLVPEWPTDVLQYKTALLGLTCFDGITISIEDRQRSHMYVANRERHQQKDEYTSVEDWLSTLSLRVACQPLSRADMTRAAQLLNKTNQMNLSTRRMSEREFAEWSAEPGHSTWVVRVADKFGDLGLSGIMSLAQHGTVCTVVDFVLSCRAMGRKVEETMLAAIVRIAQSQGAQKLILRHLATAKNSPCLEFLRNAGLERSEDGATFSHITEVPYSIPAQVTLEMPELLPSS